MSEQEKIIEYYEKLAKNAGNAPAKSSSKRPHDDDEQSEPQDLKKRVSVLDKNRFSKGEPCRSTNNYTDLKKIGEGTYGAVYKARCKATNKLMALKKLKLESETEGFPITSIRETITLLKGKHPNVIDVKEIVFGDRLDEIYIVMEYMPRDLRSLMNDMDRSFTVAEAKLLLKQLLSAINHLHNNWILHRDLKTSNLLINKGILKVCDFGLAREYGSPLKQYTNKVVTLWYRAPELLLQTGKYSTPIDIWSIGCVFGELFTSKALFQGQNDISQVNAIFETLGSPTEELWPEYEKIKLVRAFKWKTYKFNRLLDKLPDRKLLSDRGFHLWNKLLAYNPGVKHGDDENFTRLPTHRITAEAALQHDWFKEEPKAIHPDLFPTWTAKKPPSKPTNYNASMIYTSPGGTETKIPVTRGTHSIPPPAPAPTTTTASSVMAAAVASAVALNKQYQQNRDHHNPSRNPKK